ncbi:peptidyl-prolyl cis-trans isomerase [Paraferrimonas sedimenticola]|uniref:PpiC domain-containing protein n=1 Tax=Paraferrimonas sedimenticola TaxID=375674 RepID=A0AA37RRY3_9GAMM|nr:peptidylprolyl isomerase [Paraferrimonas sedimenticola]GLP94938.1 hypothetical protein GCM10007895_02440 [Paraferrimonas sedimenticola]
MTDTLDSTLSSQPKSLFGRLSREPLVHFLLAAAGLFAAHSWVDNDNRQLILVDASRQAQIIASAQSRQLAPLSEKEREVALNAFVDEEVLFQEAINRGYVSNSKVRELLLQNMRYFISGGMQSPSESQLVEFFEDNPKLFVNQATVDIEHIQFNKPESVPDGLLGELRSGFDHTRVGDFDSHNAPVMRYLDESNLLNHFDQTVATAILESEDDNWYGPILSSYGSTHFFKVTARREASMPSFEQVKPWVETFWVNAENERLLEQALQEIRPNYRIELQVTRDNGVTDE